MISVMYSRVLNCCLALTQLGSRRSYSEVDKTILKNSHLDAGGGDGDVVDARRQRQALCARLLT